MKIGQYAVTTTAALGLSIVAASADLLPVRFPATSISSAPPARSMVKRPPVTSNSQAGPAVVGRWQTAGKRFPGMARVRGQRASTIRGNQSLAVGPTVGWQLQLVVHGRQSGVGQGDRRNDHLAGRWAKHIAGRRWPSLQ